MSAGRTWLAWHSWIGVTCGLLLFVICWSGTVAVLAHEIDTLLDPARRVEAPPAGPVTWQAVIESARQAAPGSRVTQLLLPEGPHDAAQVLAEDPQGRLTRIHVDPASARVQGTSSYFSVQRFFRSFHMNLFFNTGMWGYYVVCAFALPLLASMVTALVFYKRWWQRWLAFKVDRGWRIAWSDLHKTGGLWSLWFVALMAVTGAWYFIEAAGVDMDYPELPKFESRHAGPPIPVDEALRQARARWPELEVRSVTLPGGWFGHSFVLDGQAGDVLVRDRANRLLLDPHTGAEQARQRASDLSAGARWVDMADPLHFGNFAGLPVKLLWFVFGLLLCSLSLTGAYLHVQRLRRKHAGQARRTAVTAAYAVSLFVLLVSVVGGWAEIRGYGPLVDGVRQWPSVPAPVIVFIGTWIAVTCAVLAVWVHRLR